jgi:penicillin-binding protein 1A
VDDIHVQERAERKGRRFPAVVLLALIAVIAASWLGMFSFLGTNSAFGTIEDLENRYFCNADDMELSFPDLSRLSEVWTSDGVLLGKLTERNSQPTPLEEIPDLVIGALLSAEDAHFYEHEGVDFRSLARAVIFNARGDSTQGGSTITQQVVKQQFLTSERTFERKICEAMVAAELERRYTKDQILEFYANSAFYGENAYGLAAAAQEYFGKDLDDLTPEETAAMVTPIRNPSLYDLRDKPVNVTRARNDVLDQMVDNGYLTAEEGAAAKAKPLRTVPKSEFEELAPQVVISARDEVLNDPRYGLGDTYLERKRALFGCPADDTECSGGGGLEITVTVDYGLQQEANQILRSWFVPGVEGPTGAIAMVDNRTGAIKVMASGLDFGEDVEAGERPYDLASRGRRQAGSSFKPFTLIAALEQGALDGWPITLGSFWDSSSPVKIECGYPCSPDGDVWTVSNAGGGGSGVSTLEAATYNSTNTVFAQVSFAVGPEATVEVAHRMGIESPLNPVLSIPLGTNSVSPLEMASAYSTIANYGVHRPSYLIERIEDSDGSVVYEHEVEEERVLDETLSAAVVSTLKKVVSGGTATRANIGRPQAGKTGTSQDFSDVWFMGFIPQYTTAVWVGYPDARVPMVNFKVYDALNGREQGYQRAYGGTLAAPIWKQFMLAATDGLPVEDFPPVPDGVGKYYAVPSVEVPDISGMDKKEAETAIRKAGLRPEVETVGSLEPAGTIVGQEPGPGASARQGSVVRILESTGEIFTAPLPNYTGVHADTIIAHLANLAESTGVRLGWGREDQVVTDPEQIGRVIGTRPAAGTVVETGNVIIFVVGTAG